MDPSSYQRAKVLFLRACELPVEERAAFVEHESADDATLLRDVQSLLAHHDEEALGGSAAQPPADSAHPLVEGQVYAERYRILSRIGRGGMGEVYRAHDQLLEIIVAIKRLRHVRPGSMNLFLNEVRLARQVTHPTVCRVYDVGEWEGSYYLTMEYVDGEDLSSLLHRIGRLPADKVVEIGRSLCVGLAAAHAQGVVHRDLKPANIMLDGEGHVRITDFGIATSQSEQHLAPQAGTPSYMAPEQFGAGGHVSEQSDLYSLGLVLYEMVSGQPAFFGDSFTKAAREHEAARVRRPTEMVPDLDPQLEKLILWAIEEDPADRPASALEMATRLPGANVLDMALEANITPSPALVAKAGTQSSLHAMHVRRWMWSLFGLLLVFLVVGDAAKLIPQSDEALPPSVRSHQARTVLATLGYDVGDATTHEGYLLDPSETDMSRALRSWYRVELPAERTRYQRDVLDLAGHLNISEAAAQAPRGWLSSMFDDAGRLVYLESHAGNQLRADSDSTHSAGSSPDLAAVLTAVGLNGQQLQAALPEIPEVSFDRADAWKAAPSWSPDSLRIDVAWQHERPVYVTVQRSALDTGAADIRRQRGQLFLVFSFPIVVLMFFAALFLSISNIRNRRVDTSGTVRLVVFSVVVLSLRFLLLFGRIPHPDAHPALVYADRLMNMLVVAASLAILYPAFEPTVRRYWPHTLVAWNRILQGRFRDALVGRAILIGAVVGTFWGVLYMLDALLPISLDLSYYNTALTPPRLMAGTGVAEFLALVLNEIPKAISVGGMLLMTFALFRRWFRHTLLAAVALVLLFVPVETIRGSNPVVSWLTIGLGFVVPAAWVLVRWGILALLVALFVRGIAMLTPVTLDTDLWYSWASGAGIVMIFAVGMTGAFLVRQKTGPSVASITGRPSAGM